MKMGNDIQLKAKMILAGLAAAVPAIATANTDGVQTQSYCAPYNEQCQAPSEDSKVTGLTDAELAEGKQLVQELNQLDVVTVTEINLTKAPRNPYRYNFPDPADVADAKSKNLERLAKLRAMIEAAK
jgi:hypothetical protein